MHLWVAHCWRRGCLERLLGYRVWWRRSALHGTWGIVAQVHGTHLIGELLRWRRGRRGHVVVWGLWRLSISCRSSWWRRVSLWMCSILLDVWIVLTGHWRWRHTGSRGNWLHHTCWWSVEHLRRPPIVPIVWLCRTSSKSALVAPHPWLGLGVRGCSNITLLTHVDGMTVTVFSCLGE